MIVRQSGFTISHELFVSPRELKSVVNRIAESLQIAPTFDITLVNDTEMARCNSEQMGLTGPTNTLAFPSGDNEEDSSDDYTYGDIILNVDALSREAFLYGQAPQTHLVRLLTHSILHLLGYDHSPEMFSLTDEVVTAFTGDC